MKRPATSSAAWVIAALALGLTLGVLGHGAAWGERAQAIMAPIGQLWVNALRMTVIPLIVPLLVVAIAGSGDLKQTGALSLRMLLLFMGLLAAFTLASFAVSPALMSAVRLDPAATSALMAQAAQPPPAAPVTPSEWLVSLVPANAFKAAADGALLPLLVFTVAFALATTNAPPATRSKVVEAFRAVAEVMIILVRWVVALAPIGVLALSFALGVSLGAAGAGAVGYFLAVSIGLYLLGTLLLYPLAVFGGRVGWRRFAVAMLPVQAVGLSSRSSLASLPALIKAGRDDLRLRPEVADLVLPVAVSTFKLQHAIATILGVAFVARLYGLELTPLAIAASAGAGILIGATTPGVPSAGLMLQAPLYSAFGLPLEGLALLIAIDSIPDMFKTLFNVTADMVVAVLLSPQGTAEAGDVTVN
ncbi:dicarboxylate/amino acid:cation symporter [Phenylobacterium sp. LH3H17]|uniref:dicarboxylate/amino acid:cation symporter n=1 Tax=Phenylobacterium sp. LH3H17 TaxID=2903901 RepID=UPI0020C95C00|nr:cation:dicarboxylase symporter family transporter [Phenylobacterium sp. LH3H17]UTP37715.1 dicarboxylate/amino acid:cation symporter [Phenylobacterium sp. LH3H17]